jgi:hypothetical protein
MFTSGAVKETDAGNTPDINPQFVRKLAKKSNKGKQQRADKCRGHSRQEEVREGLCLTMPDLRDINKWKRADYILNIKCFQGDFGQIQVGFHDKNRCGGFHTTFRFVELLTTGGFFLFYRRYIATTIFSGLFFFLRLTRIFRHQQLQGGFAHTITIYGMHTDAHR